jgi:integrase
MLRHDLTARGYALSTISEYVRYDAAFLDWLPVPVEEIDRLHVREFIADGPSPSQRRWRWLALKTLTRMLTGEGIISPDPMLGIRTPKLPECAQSILSDADLAALVATCGGRSQLAIRDRAVLLTLASTGARRAELTGLDLADVDLSQGTALIRNGKGGKTRVTFLDTPATRALMSWVRVRGDAPGPLWLGQRGRLTSDGIRQLIERRAKQAGVRATAHMFRRRLAATWLRNGGSQVGLMSAAGWTSPQMPARYVRAQAAEIAQAEHRRLFA